MSIEAKTERVMALLDREGSAIPLSDWIELLQAVSSQCESREVAAREDQRRQAAKK